MPYCEKCGQKISDDCLHRPTCEEVQHIAEQSNVEQTELTELDMLLRKSYYRI